MRRIFKYDDIQNIILTHDKELNNLVYWTLSYVIIYENYTLIKWSLRITEFGTNRQLICDFLLMLNTNLPYLVLFPRYSRRRVQNRHIWLRLLRLTPTAPTEGSPGMISVKLSVEVKG